MGNNREEVIAWLEAGEAADYRTGVLLLQEHGSNRSLVNTLLKKESAGHREKLVYELVKLVAGGRLEDVSEVMSHFAVAVQGATPSAPGLAEQLATPLVEQPAPALEPLSEELRAVVEELTVRMQSVYNRRCQLSNTLAELPEAEGPRVVAEILALQEEYNALAEQRRQAASGQPLEPEASKPAVAVADRAALLQKRGNLRSQLSKAKKAAEAKPDDQLKAEKVAKLHAELDELEIQIKQFNNAA